MNTPKSLLLPCISIGLFLSISQCLAETIDCHSPKTALAKVICHSSKISRMNIELSALYKPYASSALFRQIQQDWQKTLQTNFYNNVAIDINQHSPEQTKLQEDALAYEYQKQIDFYKALNSPPIPSAKIIVPTTYKNYTENYSGDWKVYTIGTIPRYAGQEKDKHHLGVIDNVILAANFIHPNLYAVIYVVEKYDAAQATINNKQTLLPWTSSLYRYNSSRKDAFVPFEENKRIQFINDSYFYNIKPEEPTSTNFYNPGTKNNGFRQNTYFYQYFDTKNQLINKKYSFQTGKIQNTDQTITDLPEHIQIYNNIEVKVVRIPISELQRNYDNTQLKISYKPLHSNKIKTEQIYDIYTPPGYEDSNWLNAAWSKNYPYLYMNIFYSHPNQFGFSNILKIDIKNKTIEQILPSDGSVAYHPYPISLGRVEAILYIDRSELKIAINMNSVPHKQTQETTNDPRNELLKE